jgi:hypothetical protein
MSHATHRLHADSARALLLVAVEAARVWNRTRTPEAAGELRAASSAYLEAKRQTKRSAGGRVAT